ncbi:MAG: hypothetical protein KDD70_15290, partial [Bdellovibrionales bacterium]|nr:hypothetical protein [Bdellovibrionales bacterium]
SPGFLVNRVLLPYLIEACLLLDEGTEKEVIDAAAKKFGMPMGPIELLDQIGLDVGLEVAEMLRQNLQATIAPLPDQVAELVEQEKLGKKKGEGFYKWEDGKPKKSNSVDTSNVTEELIDQLILPLLNACAECYRTEVITDLEKLDGAIIFATGFAPFRGGPMKYAEDRGKSEVKGRLQEFASNYGERFTPDPYWGQ